MSVTISRRLNLVLPPVETKDGMAIIHSMPISRAVFEQCFSPMARAMSAIISEGLGPITGPSVAALMLKREANAIGEADRIDRVLLPEIKRLTNVCIAGKDPMPYGVALGRGLFDEDQASEVENILVYFTLVSWVRLPEQISQGMGADVLQRLWKAQTTSLEPMAYMRSLQTSTPEESIGEKAPTTPPAVRPSSIAA